MDGERDVHPAAMGLDLLHQPDVEVVVAEGLRVHVRKIGRGNLPQPVERQRRAAQRVHLLADPDVAGVILGPARHQPRAQHRAPGMAEHDHRLLAHAFAQQRGDLRASKRNRSSVMVAGSKSGGFDLPAPRWSQCTTTKSRSSAAVSPWIGIWAEPGPPWSHSRMGALGRPPG